MGILHDALSLISFNNQELDVSMQTIDNYQEQLPTIAVVLRKSFLNVYFVHAYM